MFTTLKEGHSKIKNIHYDNLQIQKYMTSPLFTNEEVKLIHQLRSRSFLQLQDPIWGWYKLSYLPYRHRWTTTHTRVWKNTRKYQHKHVSKSKIHTIIWGSWRPDTIHYNLQWNEQDSKQADRGKRDLNTCTQAPSPCGADRMWRLNLNSLLCLVKGNKLTN